MNPIIRNNNISIDQLLVDESIFSTANGYLGARGNFAEGYGIDSSVNGTFINGFYDFHIYSYEENLTGFPQSGQTIVNLIDGHKIEFLINGIPINKDNASIINLERSYDIENGYTTRKIHYKTKDDFEFIITEKQLVSFNQLELFLIDLTIESINYTGQITLKSYLVEPVTKTTKSTDPRTIQNTNQMLNITDKYLNNQIQVIKSKTTNSNLTLITSSTHNDLLEYSFIDSGIVGSKSFDLTPKKDFTITKYIVYTTSNYHDNPLEVNNKIIKNITDNNFNSYQLEQEKYLTSFWKKSKISIFGNKYLEQVLNYNIYQLNSSAGNNSNFSISAKGLSGDGYEGHYFWDTEIYMIPFFAYTNPEKAKKLLLNRYIHLNKSKKRAKELGHSKGAKIPWRTINGDEVSPYYPAGTAQYHINSDVAYSIIKYYEVTDDLEFMINYGFELLIETARVLYDIGNYQNDEFHINSVTGPDEYTTCVDDNYYTNSMAKYHFEYIYDFYNKFSTSLSKISTSIDEIGDFKKAANSMAFIFNKNLNIYSQDRTFLNKKVWDLKNTPKSKFPLLLNFHPLTIYRHQVLKQADVLLSMFLLDYDKKSVLKDSFNYYNNITTHDSSLSKCIHSIVASSINDTKLAYKYLTEIVDVDFLNLNENTSHGLHIANMGGSYLAIVSGLCGIRINKDYLKLNPVLPEEIDGYEFQIMYQGANIKIKVSDKIYLISDKKIRINIYNQIIDLDNSLTIDLINNNSK